MKKLLAVISVMTAAVTIFCGCASSQGSSGTAASSNKGNQVTASSDGGSVDPAASSYKRVVALSRSVSDMWLLAGGSLVGTTEDALDLPDMTAGVESIGTISRPNAEKVVSLKPDVVLMTLDVPSHKKFKTELENLGIAVRTVDINSFQDYDDTMKSFTSITGRDDLYQKNVQDVRTRIDTILDGYDKTRNDGKTYLLLRISATKNTAMKKDFFGCEILDDFGLRNMADDNSSLDELSLEAVSAADPDYIFIIYQGKEDEAENVLKEEFTSKDVWKKLTAVTGDRVYTLPKDLFEYKPNARWDEAYQYIDEILQ